MGRGVLLLLLLALPAQAVAEVVVAARTIRARTIITAQDLAVQPGEMEGGFESIAELVGLEARVTIYQGRPLRPAQVGPPALIERNQIVTLVYLRGGLTITAEARALGRAGAGETVRVMNTASRAIVSGTVTQAGIVVAQGSASGLK